MEMRRLAWELGSDEGNSGLAAGVLGFGVSRSMFRRALIR